MNQRVGMRPGWLGELASLRWTLVGIFLFLAGSLALLAWRALPPTWVLAVPMAVLLANMIAALWVNEPFRGQPFLILFHVALLAMLVLAGVSRLTYLKGTFELAMGETFHGELLTREAGPLHPDGVRGLRFVHEDSEVIYRRGGARGPTSTRVRWWDESGGQRTGVIGDNTPLLLDGYRIRPTLHYGFAPRFAWWPRDGRPAERGSVHLQSLLKGPDGSNGWRIGDSGVAVLAMPILRTPIPDPVEASLFRADPPHTLRVSIRGEARDLQPGDRWPLQEGVLVYERLGTWMGFSLFYDPTMPWTLAAALVAVTGLALHVAVRFAKTPWHARGEAHGGA
ncbi:MAG: hypothetical protein HQM03_17635 [Magnetococcales bacterium]|nr:hypothetical protein [Magnetococcales bacterium]